MRILYFVPLLLIFPAYSIDNTESLLERYQVLRDSVMNQRGLVAGDLAVLETLRDELTICNSKNSNVKTLAAELQLTLWCHEDDRANELFRLLIASQPDNVAVGLAWSRFALKLPDANSESIFAELIKLYPSSSKIILDWATQLDSQNRFPEALRVVEGLDSDELRKPEAAGLLSDLLFAENRFEEALAALNRVDEKTLAENPTKKSSIDSRRTRYNTILTKWENELAIRESEAVIDDLPRVQLITSKGPILVELFEDHAPNTVANFIALAESGYYDGTRFHRVLPKFMIQGGDPLSRDISNTQAGTGGPGYTIKDEHTGEDIRNHFAGSLSMAKTSAVNSGGSQFFLTHLPTPHLDGRHTVFGRIVDGLNIARSIKKDDEIIAVRVIRKRDHDYTPEKLGPDGTPLVENEIGETEKQKRETPSLGRNPAKENK